MATGSDIVTDALFACGALGQGDALSNSDAQLCLRRLNRMLGLWSNVRQMVYEIADDTFSTVVGTQSYSSSLLASTLRPVRVDSMYLTLGVVDYDIELIGSQEWDDIPFKTVSSIPGKCYVQMGMPNATFWLYPSPSRVFTVHVGVQRPLPTTITLATVLSLPPGYEKALVECLAVDICKSMTGQPPSPDMYQLAREAKQVLGTVNYEALIMKDGLPRRGWYSQADFERGI